MSNKVQNSRIEKKHDFSKVEIRDQSVYIIIFSQISQYFKNKII